MKALIAVAAGVLATAPTTVSAAWSELATGTGRAAAAIMPAGNAPTAAVSPPNATTVSISWSPSSGTALVAGYEVRVYDAATSVERSIGASCAGIVTATSCAEAGAPAGTWRYSVTPRNEAWRGAESAPSGAVLVDPTAPSVLIGSPTTTTYSRATWDAGCGAQICGTAADTGSGVASVAVSVRQGNGNYWNGTGFTSPIEVLLPATGTTSWTFGFPSTNFTAGGSYTVRAVATDGAGNTAAATVTPTLDLIGPNPVGLNLVNANGRLNPGTDEVRITYSEPLAPSSVCATWTGPGDHTLAGSAVTVTVTNGLFEDTVTVTAAGCTLHVGSVATARDYVTTSSTFSGTTVATESRVTWMAATNTLTIHVGAQTSGIIGLLPQLAATVTYTPDAAITDQSGNPIATAPFLSPNQRF